METQQVDSGERERRLDELVTAYLKAVESGQALDRKEILAQNPDLAEELTEFFKDQDRVVQLAAPLRAMSAPGLGAQRNASGETTLAPDGPAAPRRGDRVRYFGDYELLEEIARGGMGVVFKARQVSLNRIVALKMILAGQLASPAEVQRFHSEAEAAANLDHPNIVPIYEVGEHQGQHYFSMKLMEGGNLAKTLSESRWPVGSKESQRRAASLVAQVAQAVDHAHQRGILHRDLKPANILLDGKGEPLVTDFGLAKQMGTPGADSGQSSLTQTGAIVGTPSYMAPEQASGKKGAVTTLSDVYSLGAILYEMLTGRPPFRGETPMETLLQVQKAETVPPAKLVTGLDRNLEAICLKCLEKDPKQRYATPGALAEDLEHWLVGEPIQARPPSMAFLLWVWVRKNIRAAMWVVIIGFICGGFGSAFTSARAFCYLLNAGAKTYREFPSLDRPWPLTDLSPPDWILPILSIAGFVMIGGAGLLVVLLVRPKDWWADLGTGLGTGLVGGISSFILSTGPAYVIAFAVVPSLADLTLLRQGTFEEGPNVAGKEVDSKKRGAAATLIDKYPDLRAIPAEKRGQVIFAKMIDDHVAGIFKGIWLGSLMSLGFGLGIAVCETMAAGYLVRSGKQVRALLLPYLELAVPGYLLVTSILQALFSAFGIGHFTAWLESFLMYPLLLCLAILGVTRPWPWLLRLGLYSAWVATFWAVNAFWTMPGIYDWPTWVIWLANVLAYGGLGVLLAHYYDRHRKRKAGLPHEPDQP